MSSNILFLGLDTLEPTMMPCSCVIIIYSRIKRTCAAKRQKTSRQEKTQKSIKALHEKQQAKKIEELEEHGSLAVTKKTRTTPLKLGMEASSALRDRFL